MAVHCTYSLSRLPRLRFGGCRSLFFVLFPVPWRIVLYLSGAAQPRDLIDRVKCHRRVIQGSNHSLSGDRFFFFFFFEFRTQVVNLLASWIVPSYGYRSYSDPRDLQLRLHHDRMESWDVMLRGRVKVIRQVPRWTEGHVNVAV
ncbi:hypothetical protein SODALDRAFT_66043 [Sodiomyces alkalinus F11]|uniref:Uncharacterized protein n=1 Tax=Sodiomyces alkalinus (strain CBS 110278 / VKM F-3762 / F11) TaxID=1314773 RepID=A0A3N2PLP3_SODAK|nr:hypothetical protein SODALDRAFT_66043 [Sodiomyces alkalinus F11]ROT35438.1 hypothetical protein SODALDRAFT_66043 [Sodiomyces alkalinus F11]